MKAHHKGSPSVKNKALALKTAKARKMSMQASRAKACDISAMEYRYGDWKLGADSLGAYYDAEKERKRQKQENANLLFAFF